MLVAPVSYLIDAASEPELNDLHDPYGHTLGPMLRRAAEAGQLEVLKWARDKELPIDAGGTDPGGVLHEWLDHAQCESQWHVLECAHSLGLRPSLFARPFHLSLRVTSKVVIERVCTFWG